MGFSAAVHLDGATGGKPLHVGLVVPKAAPDRDVFALPNREVDGDIEGFGMVLLEAQAWCIERFVTEGRPCDWRRTDSLYTWMGTGVCPAY